MVKMPTLKPQLCGLTRPYFFLRWRETTKVMWIFKALGSTCDKMSLYQNWYLQPQVFGWKAHLSIHSFIQHISWVPAICQALFWKLRKNKWTLFLTHGNSTLWGNSKVTYFKSPPVLIPVCNVLSGGQPASAEVVSFCCHVIFFLSADTLASYPHWETHGPLGLRLQVPASPDISLSMPILHFSPLVVRRWWSSHCPDWAFTCVLHQWPWPPLLSWTLIVPLSLWRRLKLLILIVFIWHCNLFSLPPLLVPPKPDFWKGNCWLGFPATCQPSAAWFLPHPHHHGSSYWPAFTTVWWAADSSDAPNQSGPPLLPKAYSLTSMATCFLHSPITRLTGNSDGSPASSISLVLLPIVTVHASHQIQNGSSSPVTTPFILLVLLLPG